MSDFLQRYGSWAIIAGATQGIGEQFSHQLAARGLNILLIARSSDDLKKVSLDIENQYQVKTDALAIDLSDVQLGEKLKNFIGSREVGLMIYNATYSNISLFSEDSLSSKLLCLDVNCKGPLVFLEQLAKPMIARKRGGIILMSSMSGFQGSAMVSTYAASKAFNTVLAEALWEEFAAHNVEVLACVAGATRTPSFNRQTPSEKVKSAFPMHPKDVVSEALATLDKKRGPTRIVGTMNKIVCFVLQRLMSRKRAVGFISKATRNLYAENN